MVWSAPTPEPIGVGIDIEQVRPFNARTATRFFSPNEREQLSQTAAHRRDLLFWRIWTLKECYGKALGVGLGYKIRETSFELTDTKVFATVERQFSFTQYILSDERGQFVISLCHPKQTDQADDNRVIRLTTTQFEWSFE
ncbi:MAG: 4'-phosphopantetheinyl transferase family protein [Fastidiosipilaceae bacterium]